jgi:hypothetical protein
LGLLRLFKSKNKYNKMGSVRITLHWVAYA